MAASTYFAQVQQLYIAYFGRPADPVGQNYWATQIDAANGSIASLIAGFSASTESAALFGNKSTIDKVTAIYQNAFGRAPEPAGLAYWVAQLDSGKVSQAQASWTIQQSAGPGDAAAVQNKLTAAQAFTAQIDTTAEIQGYQGAAAADSARKFLAAVTQDNATATAAVTGAAAAVSAATSVGVVGTTFTLTTGVDSFVGTANADTFNGYINTTVGNTTSTLTAADVITGGAGVDTLAITVEGAAAGALPNSTITGVEKFSIRDVSSNAAASVYDFAAIQGETEVTANSSSHAVSFTNLATGTVVGVKGDGVNTTGAVTFSMAKGTDAVVLALNGVKGSDVAATATGKATSATITTVGAASTTGTITLSDEATAASAGATIKDVTINANADLTIGVAGGGADLIGFDVTNGVTNTITVTGSASKVVLNDVAAAVDVIDASAFTGGVTADTSLATLSSFKGGVGADNLTVGALTAAGTVALGAGDDVFNAAAGVVKSTHSIDGGAGIDTFGLKAVDASNLGQFSNFEIANVDSLAAVTYDLALLASKNSITKLTAGTAVSAAAATVEKIAAGVGLEIVGDKAVSGLVLKVANAATGASDAFGINFNVAADAAGAVLTPSLSATINDVETINIVSGGGALNTNSFTLTSAANSLSTVTNKVTQTINVSGADQLTLNVAGSAVDKVVVDGSAATGKLLVTGGVTTTVIKGGSADDTIILANTATTITTGAGKDVVNVTAALGGTNITSITDFAKGDSLTTAITAATAGKIGAATSLAGATDVATVLSTLFAAADTAASHTAWAAVGTDVYVVADGGAALANANVIKLSGVTDLSSWTIDTTGHITAA